MENSVISHFLESCLDLYGLRVVVLTLGKKKEAAALYIVGLEREILEIYKGVKRRNKYINELLLGFYGVFILQRGIIWNFH